MGRGVLISGKWRAGRPQRFQGSGCDLEHETGGGQGGGVGCVCDLVSRHPPPGSEDAWEAGVETCSMKGKSGNDPEDLRDSCSPELLCEAAKDKLGPGNNQQRAS